MLDLNTSARKELRVIEATANHIESEAFLVIAATLPFVLGSYEPPKKEEAVTSRKQTPLTAPTPKISQAAAPDPKEPAQDPIMSPFLKTTLPQQKFERAVFLMPYSDRNFVKELQEFVFEANLTVFSISRNTFRELRTKNSQKKNRSLRLWTTSLTLKSSIRVSGLHFGGTQRGSNGTNGPRNHQKRPKHVRNNFKLERGFSRGFLRGS